MKTLSNRHMAFVDEYMANGRNATGAYKIVYPSASQRTAEVKGSLLVNKVEVQAELAKREAELREKNKVSIDMLTEKLLAIADNATEFAPGAAVSALKLLAQIHGLDTPKDTTQELSKQEDKTINIKIITKNGDTSNGDIQA